MTEKKKRAAVLDIGGTSIKAGLFCDGEISELKEFDTNASRGGAYIMERAKEIIWEYKDIDGIGISTAGQVDFSKGSIRYANSNIPGYTGTKIRDILEEEFHVPVAVENDVNAAALGEAHYGAGKDMGDFICLTYGTGVGGAIILGGDVYRGSSFSAGEMGAMIVHPEDRNAKEDMYSGCYEKYASTTALVKKMMELDPALDSGRKIFEELKKPIDTGNPAEAERKEKITKVLDEWIGEITEGLVSLIHIFNPSGVIMGGGIMAQDYVLEGVKSRVMENIMESYRHVVLNKAFLGNQAGLFGASHLIMKRLEENNF